MRPTTRVLKTLNGSDKLPPRTAAAYRCATRVDDPDTQVNYLREAVSHAQEELALVTYIQKRFDQGIFERHRSFADPIFESRDTARPAWRGAVVHAGGEYAWLVYVAIHDHFHSEVKAALQGMRRAGTLGPSSLDELILQQQQAEEARLVFKMQALSQVLASIKESVAGGGRSTLRLDGLEVQIEVETIPYEDWDVERDPQGQVAPPRWRRGTRSLGAKLASVRRTANSPRDKAAPDGRPRTATLRLARERTRVRPRRAPLP